MPGGRGNTRIKSKVVKPKLSRDDAEVANVNKQSLPEPRGSKRSKSRDKSQDRSLSD